MQRERTSPVQQMRRLLLPHLASHQKRMHVSVRYVERAEWAAIEICTISNTTSDIPFKIQTSWFYEYG